MQFNISKPLAIAPFFLWGTAMVAMKSTLDNTTPLFMAGVRLLPAAAIYGLPQPKTLKAWLWIGLFALVDGAMFQGLFAQGLTHTFEYYKFSNDSSSQNFETYDIHSEGTPLTTVDIIEELIEDLQMPDPTIREKAIWELTQEGESRAIPALVQLMMEKNF